MMKQTIFLILTLFSVSLAAQNTYTVIGFEGKDTIHLGKTTLGKNGSLSIKLGDYKGNIQLQPTDARYNDIQNHLKAISRINTKQKLELAKAYVADTLSFDVLYHSGLWQEYIQQWVGFYFNSSPTHDAFTDAFIPEVKLVIDRTMRTNRKAVSRLTKDLIQFFEQYGLDRAAEQVAAYSLGLDIEKDEEYQNLTFNLVAAARLIDSPAIPLTGLPDYSFKGKTTLLFFYESGCQHCDTQIALLKRYNFMLQEQGVHIISIASDTDEVIFSNKAKTCPWADKLCDFKSFAGENFVNYGVNNTPTFYVIDSDGIIKGRYAELTRTGLLP